ncbi:MAG: nitrate- and nitrite sensing domain-containing protein [Pseudonocardiales bacterium]
MAALLLGGLRMESALATSASYARLEGLAHALPQVDALVDALQSERDSTAGLISASPQNPAKVATQRRQTDGDFTALRNRLVGVDTSHDTTLQRKLQSVLSGLGSLDVLRRRVDSSGVGSASITAGYTTLVQGLLGLAGELSAQSGNGDLTRRATALESLAGAKEAASQQRAILYRALLTGGLHGSAFTDLVAAKTAQTVGVTAYQHATTAAGRALYRVTVTGPAVDKASALLSQVLNTGSTQRLGLSASQWQTAASDQIGRIGQVQADQLSILAGRIHSLGQSARNDALTSAGIIYLILGFALLATVLVARSILRPLKTLRSAALDVAYQRLPDTVRRLQDADVPEVVPDLAPIGIEGADEIGQVARAFDAVHTEAVRLASQQALMRGNVSKMFVNLSRRSQALVERQLRLIDELEAGEQDAEQLDNLFRLDHLATRMRRNDENLLVLAGAEGGRRRSEPVPMLDVLRAASAEVEQYARVRLDAQTGFELAGAAVNDVVHLVAELVENATTFSPPSAPVWVRSHSLGASGEMMIEVEDHGIGMTSAELQAANSELITPAGMDVSMAQLMGLFVVARLAHRHGIHVQLRAAPTGGLTAFVRLPAALVTSSLAALPPNSEVAQEPPSEADNSPIYDALQSQWFTSRIPYSSGSVTETAQLPRQAANWQSPGDDGWRAAAALVTPAAQPDRQTAAGLPVRVPGRNLVPGTATPSAPPDATRPAARASAQVNPTESRALSSYQQGIHRARVASPAATREHEPTAAGLDEQKVQP